MVRRPEYVRTVECNGVNGPRDFIVLTTSRSGSTMFLDSLNHIVGVEGHMELFLDQFRKKPPIAGQNDYPRFVEKRPEIGTRRPRATWDYLSELFDRNTAIGFKLMYTHLKNYPEIVPYSVVKNIRMIHLVRSNYLDVVISEKLAALTGSSHTTDGGWRMDHAIHLDPTETLKAIKKRARQVNTMTAMCRVLGGNSITVHYEDLARDHSECMARVCGFLGIDNVEEFSQSSLKKRQTRGKREAIENFDEVAGALRKHGYHHLLDS